MHNVDHILTLFPKMSSFIFYGPETSMRSDQVFANATLKSLQISGGKEKEKLNEPVLW